MSDRGVESRVSAERIEAQELHPYTLTMIEGRASGALHAHLSPGLAWSVCRNDIPILAAEIRRLRAVAAGVADLSAALGESLMRTRLAMTALDLGDPGECNAILSALCRVLVDAGAVDPMEAE